MECLLNSINLWSDNSSVFIKNLCEDIATKMASKTKLIIFGIVSALVLAGFVIFDMMITQEVSALNPPDIYNKY
jgi:hypothetical protein